MSAAGLWYCIKFFGKKEHLYMIATHKTVSSNKLK